MKYLKLIIAFLLLSLTLAAQDPTIDKGSGWLYFTDVPGITPDTTCCSELAINTVKREAWVWNRSTEAWETLSGFTKNSGVPSGDPGTGAKLYLDTATGTLYKWTGTAWEAYSSGGGSQNLSSVLSTGNDAGGSQIRNVADPTLGGDVVNLSYFNANKGGGGGSCAGYFLDTLTQASTGFVLGEPGYLNNSGTFITIKNTQDTVSATWIVYKKPDASTLIIANGGQFPNSTGIANGFYFQADHETNGYSTTPDDTARLAVFNITARGIHFFPDEAIASNFAIDTSFAEMSIDGIGTSGNKLKLVNDNAAPGNNMVYGTNGAGVKGWKSDPSGSDTHIFSENKTATEDRDHDLDGNSLTFSEGSQSVIIETTSSGELFTIDESNNSKIALKVKHSNGTIGQTISSFEDSNDDAMFIVSDFGVYTSNSTGVGMNNPVATEAIGFGAGNVETATGSFGTYFGYLAGDDITSGTFNALFGPSAGGNITSGGSNLIFGGNAFLAATTANNATVVGVNAAKNANSDHPTIIGSLAAENSTNVSDAVIIGYEAARNYPNVSNKLIIHNSADTYTSTIGDGGNAPLIYGDFDTEDILFSSLVKIRDVTNTVSFSDDSAVLELESTSRGILVPRMTTSQRTAISSPADALIVHDTDTDGIYQYVHSGWARIDSRGVSRAITTDASYTATDRNALITIDDTTNDSDLTTYTLPGAPIVGDQIKFVCISSSIDADDGCSISRNGNNIDGAASDYTFSSQYEAIELEYTSSGWYSF